MPCAPSCAGIPVGGLIVTDLGVREGVILEGVETVVIDHHVPTGVPGSATVISGSEMEPIPTSSLLAYWCTSAIAEVDDLLWIAALGIIGDIGREVRLPGDGGGSQAIRHHRLAGGDGAAQCTPPERHG
jgi:single-stranded-DNA-specific exonuclease